MQIRRIKRIGKRKNKRMIVRRKRGEGIIRERKRESNNHGGTMEDWKERREGTIKKKRGMMGRGRKREEEGMRK